MLGDQNYKHASDIITSFSLQKYFDCKELITILVSRGSIYQAIDLIGDNKEIASLMVEKLEPRKYNT